MSQSGWRTRGTGLVMRWIAAGMVMILLVLISLVVVVGSLMLSLEPTAMAVAMVVQLTAKGTMVVLVVMAMMTAAPRARKCREEASGVKVWYAMVRCEEQES